tara:strand:+ start:1997 stop:2110 length:114 start_codon:yes stop_codon:yes gene_type:complete
MQAVLDSSHTSPNINSLLKTKGPANAGPFQEKKNEVI